MKLNLPFQFENRIVLLAGAGGGWDAFGSLPLLFELEQTCRVTLANYSLTARGFDVRLAEPSDHPEGKLSAAVGRPIWLFSAEGVRTLIAGYRRLIEQQGIDALILVDGGVDSLMRGDEECPGSILQDAVSLAAVEALPLQTKLLACVGFGTETEEGVCHYRVLENIAALAKAGALRGCCALTKEMEAFQFYEDACRKAFAQPGLRSHIHTRIIPAVHGEFGRYEMYDDADQVLDLLSARPPFISPLMSLFWFFDAGAVAERNLLIPALKDTETWEDVDAAYAALYPSLRERWRKNRIIPL